MFQIIRGDLTETDADYICHQVNCRNAMGSGVAKALYSRWPEVKSEYHKLCQTASPTELLGKIQVVPLHDLPQSVINVFGQLNYGRSDGVVYTEYPALQKALAEINRTCSGKAVAFPYGFGCGLAGGDWRTVESLMVTYLRDCDVKIYMID